MMAFPKKNINLTISSILILVILLGVIFFDREANSNDKVIYSCKVSSVNCLVKYYESSFLKEKNMNSFDLNEINSRAAMIANVAKVIEQKNLPSYINEVYNSTNRLENNCYGILEAAGKIYGESILTEKKKIAYSKSTTCRSMFNVGMLEALPKSPGNTNYYKLYAHLCDNDPEKNGCADGVGKLFLLNGDNAFYATKGCVEGALVSKPSDYFRDGCIGGFINWARYTPYFLHVTSPIKASMFCQGSVSEAMATCQGYAMRNYVRAGLPNNTARARLESLAKYCHSNVKLWLDCATYVGFATADAYNNMPNPIEVFPPKVIANVLDKVCYPDTQDNICINSFIGWYVNQWSFTNHNLFASNNSKIICENLNHPNWAKSCEEHLNFEIQRFQNRVSLEIKEK